MTNMEVRKEIKDKEGVMKYYIIDVKGDDEFELGKAETKEEAIKIARKEWHNMNAHDQRRNIVEIRLYEEDVEDENCENFDYNTVEWDKWYAVQEDETDEWGYGSYDYDEAVEMLRSQGHGQIAVVREMTNFCEDEISYEEACEND